MSKKSFSNAEIHELTLKILNQYKFDKSENVQDITNTYLSKYLEVYNLIKSQNPKSSVAAGYLR